MERKITDELVKWKLDHQKRPLMLAGIPGCGKTYTTLEFGKREYKNTVYFDCTNNLELKYVFEKNTTLDKLIRALSAISLETIFKEESLIIFDNVTEQVVGQIKKLVAGNSDYHIIMITDKLEQFQKKLEGLTLKKMNLVSFPEYLKFEGKEQLVDFIEDSFKNNKTMPFHNMAMELYNEYVLTGGYPNAIATYQEKKNYNFLSSVLENNINLITNDLIDMPNLIDIRRGIEIYNNIAYQLLKDNKKFMYGLIKSGARAKDYESAIEYMEKHNMVIKSTRISELKTPLSKIKDEENFKLYYNDTGILFKKMNVGANRLLTNDKLMGMVYEQSIVNTLSQNGFSIYNYHSTGKAQIDLVVQTRTGKIIPMEIFSNGENTKSKSMALALSKYNLTYAIRFTEDNFKERKGIKYIPYYAAFCITENL